MIRKGGIDLDHGQQMKGKGRKPADLPFHQLGKKWKKTWPRSRKDRPMIKQKENL
jgi:hypothetical protein